MTPTTSTELTVVNAQNSVQIFTGGGLNAVLDDIEAKVRAFKFDASTAAGRDAIRSLAYKVARTKTALDAEGKKLTEGWREATKKVNAERKRSEDRLDALAEEVREPVTQFENKEKSRVAAHEAALNDLRGVLSIVRANPDMPAESLSTHLAGFEAIYPERNWEEFGEHAAAVRAETIGHLRERIESRRKYETEQAELGRLRQAEVERQQRERDEQLKAEAADKARLEAERKAKEDADREAKRVIEAAEAESKRVAEAAEQVRAENERAQKQAEAARRKEEEAKLAAEKRAKDAEEARIESERVAAERLKAAEIKAKKETEAAVERERQRAEADRIAHETATKKREADKRHIAAIRAQIKETLICLIPEGEDFLIDALIRGDVPHVKVLF